MAFTPSPSLSYFLSFSFQLLLFFILFFPLCCLFVRLENVETRMTIFFFAVVAQFLSASTSSPQLMLQLQLLLVAATAAAAEMDERGVARDAADAAGAATDRAQEPDISSTHEHKTALITTTSIYSLHCHPLEALKTSVQRRCRGGKGRGKNRREENERERS